MSKPTKQAKPKKQAKSVVRLPTGAGERTPKTVVTPSTGRLNERPVFSFLYADRHYRGEWSWPDGQDAVEMLNFLCEMSSLTWSEIRGHTTNTKRAGHRKHHEMPLDVISSTARNRIQQLKHDETFGDELFRFRLAAKKRLWGYVLGEVFYVLWWDPNHRVYPTDPD